MNSLKNLDALRMDEGLVRNTHQTLEKIVRKLQPITYEPVVRECIDGSYMPDNISLD